MVIAKVFHTDTLYSADSRNVRGRPSKNSKNIRLEVAVRPRPPQPPWKLSAVVDYIHLKAAGLIHSNTFERTVHILKSMCRHSDIRILPACKCYLVLHENLEYEIRHSNNK